MNDQSCLRDLRAMSRAGARARREIILDLWEKGEKSESIGVVVNMSHNSVRTTVLKARRNGDPRAIKRINGALLPDGRKTNEVALDMWAAGEKISAIVAACGYSSEATLTTAVWRARQVGDPRAIKRRTGAPRRPARLINGRAHVRLTLKPSEWHKVDRWAMARNMQPHDVLEQLLSRAVRKIVFD